MKIKHQDMIMKAVASYIAADDAMIFAFQKSKRSRAKNKGSLIDAHRAAVRVFDAASIELRQVYAEVNKARFE